MVWRRKPRATDKESEELLDLVNRTLVPVARGQAGPAGKTHAGRRKEFSRAWSVESPSRWFTCATLRKLAAATGNEFSKQVEARAKEEGAACVVISAKIESEIAVLPEEEQADYLAAVGLEEPGLNRLISRRLRPARSRDILYRRPEGSAGLDHHARHAGAAGGRRHPH